MDLPVDGADAFVLTSLERARDLMAKPVIVHNAVLGQTQFSYEEQLPDLESTGQQVAARELWRRSDLALGDIDLFYPYDGFTVIATRWFEVMGYCDRGEAAGFLQSNWDKDTGRIMIDGRVPVNTHGGSLSDGGTQGVGHVREAALQLLGRSGNRQLANSKSALIPSGGFFYNSAAAILRID
jgi:acetyl-CoA acetyltransferase